MTIYRLDKMVLGVSNNPTAFLNGITANTIDKPKNAFLDVHGKIIATFDQLKVNDDLVFVVIESLYYDALMSHLDRYIRLSKAKVAKENLFVYYDLERQYKVTTDEFPVQQRTGQLILTKKEIQSSVSEEEFTLFRLRNNVPRHGVDYHNEMLLNVDEQEFVSYTKGCFLGQEPISKVHNRSNPTWKLAVRLENECSPEEKSKMTSKIKDPQTGRTMGFVFVSNR